MTPEKDNQPEVDNLDVQIAADLADREHLSESLHAAFEAHKSEAAAEQDLDEDVRPLRDEIERRYPNTRASESMRTMLDLDRAVRADPVHGGYKVFEHFARGGHRYSAQAETKSEKGPYGWTETKLPSGRTHLAAEGTIAHDVAKALQRAGKDDGETAALREVRKLAAELYPGKKLSEVMKQYLRFDDEASRDPHTAASKLAAMYGSPLGDHDIPRYNAGQVVRSELDQLFLEPEFRALKGREVEAAKLLQTPGALPSTDGSTRAELRATMAVLRMQDTANAEIKAFTADPRYPRFRELKQTMSQLLGTGRANGLHDAYHKAAALPKRTDNIAADVRRAANGRLNRGTR